MGAAAVTHVERPRPPKHMADAVPGVEFGGEFEPAPEVWSWIVAAFLEENAPFYNEDHQHLLFANVGILWTNVPNARQQRSVIGTAEMPAPRGSKWAVARAELQLIEWFGHIPDFIITLFAPYCAEASDASFCALVDHELYHCAQARDEFGGPKFRRDGAPVFGMRDHDASEFVGVVRRWGRKAAAGGVEALVQAALAEPEFTAADIAATCGTCLARVA